MLITYVYMLVCVSECVYLLLLFNLNLKSRKFLRIKKMGVQMGHERSEAEACIFT